MVLPRTMAKVINSSTLDSNISSNTTSFFTQQEGFSLWEEPVWLSVLRITITSAIAFAGVLGNLGVTYIVTKRSEMWTTVNFYIRNLSLTDLGVLLINYPLAVIKERFLNSWPLGEFFCRAIYPGIDVIFCVGIWTIASIAVERYWAVSRNNTRYQSSLKRARITIVTIWIVSIVIIGLPQYLIVEYIEIGGNSYCRFVWPEDPHYAKAYHFGMLIITYVLPLFVVLWTYISIATTIARSSRFHFHMLKQFSRDSQSSARKLIMQRLRQNARVRRLLTPVVLVFALSLLPINALKIVQAISPRLLYFEYIYLVFNLSVLLVVVNASVDPLIYCLVSDNFRNAFKSLMRMRIHRSKYKTHTGDRPASFQLESIAASGRHYQRRMTNSTSLFSSKEQMNKESFKISTNL